MALGFRRPSSYPIVHSDEVLCSQDCIVTVGQAPDELAPDEGPPVLALGMRCQRVGEGR